MPPLTEEDKELLYAFYIKYPILDIQNTNQEIT